MSYGAKLGVDNVSRSTALREPAKAPRANMN